MYIKATNNKTHKKYTNEEKEKIVLLYLNHEMMATQIIRQFELGNRSKLYEWIKMYQKYGCIIDNRGKATKFDNPNKGRHRKYPEKPLEELSKEELIEREKMLEDIKKSLVYLMSQQPNKSIK